MVARTAEYAVEKGSHNVYADTLNTEVQYMGPVAFAEKNIKEGMGHWNAIKNTHNTHVASDQKRYLLGYILSKCVGLSAEEVRE